MSINLVTYANQTVTPTNDAIIYEKAIDQNGIFYGCNVTVTSNTVNITGGYGIVCGREFVINSESISVTLAPSGTLDGRLYVRLDLADADAPIQLLTVTGNTLPALVQDDDVNYTNGVWEMELATFDVGVSALSDVVETFETITGTKPYADYIVENGTSGIWTYRKWNSGIAECWGTYVTPSIAITRAFGSVYIHASGTNEVGGVDYPFTFTDTPVEVDDVYAANAWLMYQGGNTTTKSKTYWVTRPNSSPAASQYSINIHVKGTWK